MNKKGIAGLTLLMVVLVMILVASTVLFDFFFMLFSIGHSAEGISTDYESLSSGVYYGIWLVDNSKTFPQNLSINGVSVSVNYNTSTHIITVGPVNGRSITVKYENGTITSWS